MKSNESLHLTIKKPPNPNPTSTLAILSGVEDTDMLISIIRPYLDHLKNKPQDSEFTQNVREEAIKSIMQGEVIAVSRSTKYLVITVKES